MTWNATPREALWYGEVVYSLNGETNYNYGYSTAPEPDDPHKHLLPEGAELLEWKVIAAGDIRPEHLLYGWGVECDGTAWELEMETELDARAEDAYLGSDES